MTLLDENEKVTPLPMENLLSKKPKRRKKPLWSDTFLSKPIPPDELELSQHEPVPAKTTWKSETKIEQAPNSAINAVKSESKSGTNAEQFRSECVTNAALKRSERGTISGSFCSSAEPDNIVKNPPSLRLVRGNQRKVLLLIYVHCKHRGDRTTEDLSLRDLTHDSNISYESTRTTLRRMIKKGLLLRTQYSTGRGGWVQYEIPESVYRTLSEIETSANPWSEMADICGTKCGSNNLCSSSNNYLTTTNKQAATEIDRLMEDLNNVDLQYFSLTPGYFRKYFGEHSLFKNVEEFEEYLNLVRAIIEEKATTDRPVKTKPRFLLGLLDNSLKDKAPIPPKGYVSLKEKRLLEEKESKMKELEKIKAVKKEKYRTEYKIFKETVEQGRRAEILEGIETEMDIKRHIVGEVAYEKAIQAKLEERLMELFVKQYDPPELQGEVVNYIADR